MLLNFTMKGRLLPEENYQARRPVELRPSELCEWLSNPNSVLGSEECLAMPLAEHGQLISWCLKRRSSGRKDDANALFALGPHAAYGAILDAAFALPNEAVPTWLSNERRISVHIRHFEETQTSAEALELFAAEIRKAALGAERCAVLLASDRRLALEEMKPIAQSIGCRLLTSERGEPVKGPFREHGEDVGSVLLSDVWLLARGHVLIGTWGSTLTLAIQQLMAARSSEGPMVPTVTYCELRRAKCLSPLPLLTVESNEWYVQLTPRGDMHISSLAQMDMTLAANTSAGWLRAAWAPFPFVGRDAAPLRGRAYAPEHWPSSDEGVAALEHASWPAEPPPTDAYLGAIISADTSSERFRAVSAAVASCGFVPRHVPAAQPSDYAELGEMMVELFGRPTARAIRMRPAELGLLISHKRALEVIAGGDHAWGAVFEDDAYLHEAVSPQQAGHMLHRAFSAAGESRTVVYLGVCSPQCIHTDPAEQTHAGGLPHALLRGGRCRGFCSHAYGLARSHATTFFDEVFGCSSGGKTTSTTATSCGAECETRPCYMDWVLSRYFVSGHPAWILGSGLASRWRKDHRGLFVQNRSEDRLMNTRLSKVHLWDSGATSPEESKARQRCALLVGNASRGSNGSGGAGIEPRKSTMSVYVTARWTGRMGNLLFVTAGLLGVAAQLEAQPFAVNLPSEATVPAKELFWHFPDLAKRVRVLEDGRVQHREKGGGGRTLLSEQYGVLFAAMGSAREDVQQCRPCRHVVEEEHANAFESQKIGRLSAWAASPPEGCTLGLVEMVGYYQSFKYFQSVAESAIRPALEHTARATQDEADRILAVARRKAPSGIVIGVQVRLGDKVTGQLAQFYALTDWSYYRIAMLFLARKLGAKLDGGGGGVAGKVEGNGRQGKHARQVAFVVTAGGTMSGSAADVAAARQHLASGSDERAGLPPGSITFSDASDPYVDLAVLRGCNALVISASSLGWWAAYLSRLPGDLIVAPRHTINPELPPRHKLRVGFKLADYYPEEWLLLANSARGHTYTTTTLDRLQFCTSCLSCCSSRFWLLASPVRPLTRLPTPIPDLPLCVSRRQRLDSERLRGKGGAPR